MKNLIRLLLLCSSITVFAQVSKPAYIQSTGFFVYEGKIYNADGSEFLMRGVNQNHFWGDETFNLNSINGIANSHANIARVVMSDQDWVNQSNTSAKKRSLVEKYLAIDMIPMVELHDGTCENSPSFIETITDSWIAPANVALFNEYEEYMILNIANEWGPGDSDDDWQVWRDTYKTAITRIRNAGINNLIVIDAPGCGQKPRAMEVYGQEILDHDPQHNVAFSIHFYGYWRTAENISQTGEPNSNNSPWLVEAELQTMLDLKLPVICGEFSWQESESCPYSTEKVIQFCEENGIGWVAWSWNGNGDALLDMVTGWKYDSDADLFDYGKLIINHPLYGLRATSQKAPVFGAVNAHPTVGVQNLQNGQIFVDGATINIQAQAEDADGTAIRTALYINNKKIAENNGSGLSYAWENVARGKYSIFVVAEDNAGAYGHSEIIEIKVGYREQSKNALFVTNNVDMRSGDAVVAERLEMLGYFVHVSKDEFATAAQADSVDMVLISSSVTPTRLKDVFANASVPVICWETFVFDDMGWTAAGANTAYGKAKTTGVDIQMPDHPMAAGLSGSVVLFAEDYLSWGIPAESADIIATISGSGEPATFIYEKGDELANGEIAQAPCVGLFLYDTSDESMTNAGWQMVDAAIDYAQSLPAHVHADTPIAAQEFSLTQNYPNPFNPITTISFSLPAKANVLLNIYNVQGKLITTLLNAVQPAGQHSVSWDASACASGLYFYSLQAGQHQQTKRMLLIK